MRTFRPRGIEVDGLKYYQERNKSGDYISIDPSTNEYYRDNGLGIVSQDAVRRFKV